MSFVGASVMGGLLFLCASQSQDAASELTGD